MISSIQVRIIDRIINQDQQVNSIDNEFDFKLIIFSLSEVRSEQEKDRLAHMMAYGIDPAKMAYQAAQRTPSPPPRRELDRFDECMRKEKEKSSF